MSLQFSQALYNQFNKLYHRFNFMSDTLSDLQSSSLLFTDLKSVFNIASDYKSSHREFFIRQS